MINNYQKNKLIQKEVEKLALKSTFYKLVQELKSKVSISDIAIDIEDTNITYNFVAPFSLTKSFKKQYNISNIENMLLSKNSIIIDGIEFNNEISEDENIDLNKSIQTKINIIEDNINDDLHNIAKQFNILQNQIAVFIDKIDETSKSGFINNLKKFINSQNKQRVLDNYMAIIDYNKLNLIQELWKQRAILYLKSEDNFLSNIKQKIKALYHIKTIKFQLTNLKNNEDKIYTQLEILIDEAYQLLYIEKTQYTDNLDTVISVKDGEIYKLVHKDAMKLFKEFGLGVFNQKTF